VSDVRRELERVEVGFPATPDLATAVAQRLRAPAPGPRRRLRRPLRVAVAVALILLLLAATALAASRAVREFFGLQGATVERTAEPPLRLADPFSASDLGDRAPLEEARRAASFDVLVPAAAGPPDEVRVRRQTPGGEVSLLYRPRAGLPRSGATDLGLLVSEFRGDVQPEYIAKIAPQATRVERLTVHGDRAIWLEGAPHLFFYRGPGGGFRERPLRLAANVLLLERGPLLVRLEGDFGRAQAVRLAESLR
jgi:hypothetical protein